VLARRGLLGQRSFVLLFAAQATSSLGTATASIALIFAALALSHGSAASVGEVLAANRLPLLLFLLLGGVVGDRLPRARVMIGADLVRLVTQICAAGLLLTGRGSLWALIVLFAIHGSATAFFTPATDGLVRECVDIPLLQRANASLSVAQSTTAIAGQAVGGLLVAIAGAGWAFMLDASTFAVSALCLQQVSRLHQLGGVNLRSSVFGELREGIKAITERTWLWVGILHVALLNPLAIVSFFALGPVVAARFLGGAAAWGLIAASFGVGMTVGGLVAMRWRPRRPLLAAFASVVLSIPQLAALAAHWPVSVVIAASALGGANATFLLSVWAGTEQASVPQHLLARVSSVSAAGSLILTPVAYATIGSIAGRVGISQPLWFGVGWIAVSTTLVLLVPAVRSFESPQAAHQLEPNPSPAFAE
jgi:Transmembrane secretion effector